MKIFEKVYQVVKKIPKGKVRTYGEIAARLRSSTSSELRRGKKKLGINPRTVGWALSANCDPKVPCHRVVSKSGKVAENYAFGGWKEQKKRLIEEGVEFRDEKRVNLGS